MDDRRVLGEVGVIYFTNMSGDPEQAHFADEITEDIITALSRVSGLLVVARVSTMTYKGAAVDIKTVGKEQGPRFMQAVATAMDAIDR